MSARLSIVVSVTLALSSIGSARASSGTYAAVDSFGANPGGLKMFLYTPATLSAEPGVVFVLHGCTSSAAEFRKLGWEELADEFGFYVVYPQTTSANNPAMCFNWAGDWGNFAPLERGQDENQSLASMAGWLVSDKGVARDRVFAMGHSSGAAMVVVALATWPDVFAAGATVGGVPYKCPGSYGEVYQCMSPGKNLDATAWGDRARSGYPSYTGPRPPLMVWHGSADTIVAPLNRQELVEQWTDLNGADATPEVEEQVGSVTHQVFRDAAGETVVESYLVQGMAHVVPIDPGAGCGTAATYFKDAGVCAPRIIADFFGLTEPPGGGHVDPDPDPVVVADASGSDTATGAADTGRTSDTAGGNDTNAGGSDTASHTGSGDAATGTRPGSDTATGPTSPTSPTSPTGGDTSGITVPMPDAGNSCAQPQEEVSLGCGAGDIGGGVGMILVAVACWLARRKGARAAVLGFFIGGGCDIGVGGQTPTQESCTDTPAGSNGNDVLVPGGTTPSEVAMCTAAIGARMAEVSGQLGAWSIQDAPEMVANGGSQSLEADYAGKYRDDLASHPGCLPRESYGPNTSEPFSTDNASPGTPGFPAQIPGYPCAAKEYTQPREDMTKSIVILFHGNSSGVTAWEPYWNQSLAGTEQSNLGGFTFLVDDRAREQLAGRLVAAGHRVIAFDARTDRVATLADWDSKSETGNPFLNVDHGWTVPMAQRLILAVIKANPDRKIALVGHSLGATMIRDALRRLYVSWQRGDAGAVNPFPHIQDVVMLSGAHHGVSTGPLCNVFPHMRGRVCCQLGDRAAYVETYFHKPLNGPRDLFATPCADGSFAFGAQDQCEGHVVQYTTVTMIDIDAGDYQDEFVSEESSRLDLEPCVQNELIGLDDHDPSGYFFTGRPGFLASHFGSARSEAGLALVVAKLAD